MGLVFHDIELIKKYEKTISLHAALNLMSNDRSDEVPEGLDLIRFPGQVVKHYAARCGASQDSNISGLR